MHTDLDAADREGCIAFFNGRFYTPNLCNTPFSMTKLIAAQANDRQATRTILKIRPEFLKVGPIGAHWATRSDYNIDETTAQVSLNPHHKMDLSLARLKNWLASQKRPQGRK